MFYIIYTLLLFNVIRLACHCVIMPCKTTALLPLLICLPGFYLMHSKYLILLSAIVPNYRSRSYSFQWRHNECHGVSNHSTVYSNICLSQHQRKRQSPCCWPFVSENHWWPVDSLTRGHSRGNRFRGVTSLCFRNKLNKDSSTKNSPWLSDFRIRI